MSVQNTTTLAEINSSDTSTPKKISTRSAAEIRDAALGYAAKGLRVFPVWHVKAGGWCACGKHNCKAVGKHPIPAEGFKAATADPRQIRDWWREHPSSNIGLACAENGLAVLDINPRNGGLDGLAELEAAHGPITSSVEAVSGGGGRHIVFALDADSSTALPGKAARGVDVKRHGYVLVAPSNHASGGTYQWMDGKAPEADPTLGAVIPTSLPAWVAELGGSRLSKASTSAAASDDEDPAFRDRAGAALAVLEAGGPPADVLDEVEAMRAALAEENDVFGQLWAGGNPKGNRSEGRLSLANHMGHRWHGERYTVHHHAALVATWEHGGEYDARQLAREWARTYIAGRVTDHDAEGFGVADDEEPAAPAPKASPAAAKPTARFLSQIVGRPLPTVSQIVKGVLTAGEIVVAAGAPGAGKSADLLHLGLCVAEGKPYHGRATKRGGVLFVGSENRHEDERRIHASMLRYGRDPEAPFMLQPACATLYEPEGKPTKHEAGIIALAATIRERTGLPCRLIVVDNLRRVISPGSANDEAHATIVMKALERIRNATGAAVVLIHHTVRDGSRFAGSGAIESHADAVWRFAPPPERKGEARRGPSTITFDKLRLGDKRQTLNYRFGFEVVAHDDDGDPISTVVALDADSGRPAGATDADFGAVDEAEGAAGLGAWPEAGEAHDSPERPAAPAARNAVEDAPDARAEAIMEAARDLAAAGRPGSAPRLADAATAVLQRRNRKAPPISDRSANRIVARLVDERRLVQVGTGKLTGYAPTAA